MFHLNRVLHTHTHTSFSNLLRKLPVLFFALLVMGIVACSDEVDEPLEDQALVSNQSLEVRSDGCGPAEDDDCVVEEVKYTITLPTFPPCDYSVIVIVSTCGDKIYFEDNQYEVSPENPSCPLTPEIAEEVYDRAVDLHMRIPSGALDLMPPCDEGEIVTSIQIRTNCTRFCEVPNILGGSTFRFRECSQVAGCCTTEREWCKEGDDIIVTDPVKATIQGCSGTVLGCNGQPLPPFNTEGACLVRCN